MRLRVMERVRRCKAILMLLFMVVIGPAGCAFSPVRRPDIPALVPRTSEFHADQGRVVQAARLALGSMAFNAFSDPYSGTVTSNPRMLPIAQNCDCGTWNGSSVGGGVATTLSAQVTANGVGMSTASVKASYKVHFVGHNLNGDVTREESYECRSLGGKEDELLKRISQYLVIVPMSQPVVKGDRP